MPDVQWGARLSRIPPPVAASSEPISRLFSWHDAHPISLTMTLLEKFGPGWVDWEAETLREEILRSFRATSISEHNWNKIQSCKALAMSNAPWKEWHVFEKVVQALNNNVPLFATCQRCSVAQLMAGVDIINTLRKEEFDEEVRKYVAGCAIEDGITYLPAPLEFAATELARPMYRCLDCGNTDLDDLQDGRCDFCSGRFSDLHPFNFQPSEVSKGAGTNVERTLTRDPFPAKKRFEELMEADPESVEVDDDSPEDVQAAKLVVAHHYMLLRRRQLSEQLKELKEWTTH